VTAVTIQSWVAASNRIEVRSAVGWALSALAVDLWTLTRSDDEISDTELLPWISSITAVSGGASIGLDVDMVGRTSYVLTAPDLSDASEVIDSTILGPARSAVSVSDVSDKPLTDWAMPANGAEFGGDVGAVLGDIQTVGENDAIEIAVWNTLLTPRGSIEWDPTFGADLRQKRVRSFDLANEQRRLAELVATVAGVSSARVLILFGNDYADITVTVSTAAGEIPFEKRVSDGVF